jgi:hypothetical protein
MAWQTAQHELLEMFVYGLPGEDTGQNCMNYPDKREINKNMLKFSFNAYIIDV